MKLDPLYLLLLIEVCCLLTAGLVFVLIRHRKNLALCQSTTKDLASAKRSLEELRKQLSTHPKNAESPPANEPAHGPAPLPPGDATELDEIRTKLQAAEEALREKDHQMQQLQAKFADLEKEYMVLYQQQQQNQQAEPAPS